MELDSLLVPQSEIKAAADQLSPELKEAIQKAKANIERFHQAQEAPELIEEVMPGVVCRRKSVAIQRVGLYIPGGTAPLFSTVLMLGCPCQNSRMQGNCALHSTQCRRQGSPSHHLHSGFDRNP